MRKNILRQIGFVTALVLFSLISWVTVTSAVVLTVNSSHGAPDPFVGNHNYAVGDVVPCSVTSPADEAGGTRYVCTGWTGTGSVYPSTGTGTSVTFTINVDSTITWLWKTQHQLTTSVSPLGTGTITITPTSGTWQDEGNISVTANPEDGYIFSGWADDLSGTDNPATLNMNGPKTVTANFVPGYTLTVSSEHDSCAPDVGSHPYTDGDPVTCSVTSPVSGGTGIQYVCTGWAGTGSVPASGTGTTTTFTISEDSTITWNWKTQYKLTTTVSPSGTGTITPASGTWHDAGDITVTANPGAGYIFKEWSGALSGSINPVTLTMDGPKSVTANFGYALTVVNPGDHDTPTPRVGSYNYTPGASVTCSVTSPADEAGGTRYVCTGWTGTGSVPASGTEATVTFTIDENSTITWNWKKQYQLTTSVSPEGGGSVSLDPTSEGNWYDDGAAVEVTAEPSSGYKFVNWAGDLSGTTNPDTITMNSAKTVTANFKKIIAATMEGLTEVGQGILPLSQQTKIMSFTVTDAGDNATTLEKVSYSIKKDIVGYNNPFDVTTNIARISLYRLNVNETETEIDWHAYEDAGGTWDASGNGIFDLASDGNSTGTETIDDETKIFYIKIQTSDDIIGTPDDDMTIGSEKSQAVFYVKINSINEDENTVTCNSLTCEAQARDLWPFYGGNSVENNTSFAFPGYSSRPRWDSGPDDIKYADSLPRPQDYMLLAMETPSAVVGIACAGGTSEEPEKISQIKIKFEDSNHDGSFNPQTMLDILRRHKYSGVMLYKDADEDGKWSENDSLLPYSSCSWNDIGGGIYELTYNVDTGYELLATIPRIATGRDVYFIVIRADSGYTDEGGGGDGIGVTFGAPFKVYLEDNAVTFTNNPSEPSTTGERNTTIVSVCNLRTYVDSDYTKGHDLVDATSPVIPLFGINAADTADSEVTRFNDEKINQIKVYFTNVSEFQTSDLATLAEGGISLWKDNKSAGRIGVFDESNDEPIEIYQPVWNEGELSITIEPKIWLEIYPDDYTSSEREKIFPDTTDTGNYRGDDYFVCFKTSDTIFYKDEFSVAIQSGGITFAPGEPSKTTCVSLISTSANIKTNLPTFLTDLTTVSQQNIYSESDPTGVIGINLIDTTNSCDFTQLIVEFYDKGEFNPDTDLATMSNNENSGLALYKDTNRNGEFDPSDTVVTLDKAPYYTGVTGEVPFQFKLDFTGNPQAIPLNDEGTNSGPDYFVVIKTSGGIGDGDMFSVGIVGWGCAISGNHALIYDDSGADKYSYERQQTNTLIASHRIGVTSPSIEKDPARNHTYIITWTNKGLDSGTTISIYYDTNQDASDLTDATLIASSNPSSPRYSSDFSSATGSQSYTWDASSAPEGNYYIYIRAEKSGTYITSDYSSETVWVKDDNPPTVEVSEPSSSIIFDGCTDTFVDGDGATSPEAAEDTAKEIISLGTLLTSFKTSDLVYWYDADSSNTWSDGDALWIDKNYDGRYDSGDSLIIGSPVVNTSGTILTDDYHFVYYDINKNIRYDSGEDIYYEAGTGNRYNYYSGSSSDYVVTIGYDARDSDSVASLTLLADDDTNSDNGFALTITTLAEEDKAGTYLWDVSGLSGVSYYVGAKVDDGFNYPVYAYSSGKVGVNGYPYIKVSAPSVDTWTYSTTYTITWTDSDPDDNALISLYYDEDAIFGNGNETLIDTTTEDSTTDSYTWDISSVPNGTYYIVGKIDDGANDPYYSYSKGKLTIMDTPEVILEAVESYDAVTLNWVDNTPKVSDKTIEIYRKDYKNWEWSEYAKIAAPSSSETSYEDTSLSLGVIGGYFVQIYSASLGTLYLSNSSTSTINPLEARRLAFPDEETPSGLKAIPGVNVITVQWNDNSNEEDNYEVERKLESEGIDKYTNITTTSTNTTSYDDFDATADVTYSYRARARKYYPETGNYGYSKYTGEAAETSYTFDKTIGEAGGGGSCFIATASYSSPMAEEIIVLKRFRDDILMKTTPGKGFVNLYYAISPPIADFIRNKPGLKAMVREVLKPLVEISKEILNKD